MKYILTLLFVFVYCAADIFAIEMTDLKFRRLDARHGLSNSSVNCVLQDSRGFVWIGTKHGLNRYDGVRVRTFYSNAKDTTALRYDYVGMISETSDGRLLLQQGTYYCFYDQRTESFDYNLKPWLKKIGVEGNLERIYIDSHKNYWIKVYNGNVFRHNPYTGKTTTFAIDYAKYGMSYNCLFTSFADFGKDVFAMTNSGRMICFDVENGGVKWVNSFIRRIGGQDNVNYYLTVSPRGDYWVLAEGAQWVYSQQTRKWYRSICQYLSAMGFADVPDGLIVWDIMFHKSNKVWIATDHNGLFVADLSTKRLAQYKNDKIDNTSISDETITKIYTDLDGNVWVGTYKNGVNQCVINRANAKNLMMGNVNTITEDKEGNYWFGTNDRGVIKYNPRTTEQVMYNMSNSGLKSDIIVSSLASSDGSLWFGTYGGGVSQFKDGKVITRMHDGTANGIANNNVWALAQDRDGNVWIGTLGGGVQRIDGKTGHIATYDETSNLSSNYISSMQMAENGLIVVGTSDNYSFIDPDTRKVTKEQFKQDASRQTVVTAATTQVIMDSRGLLWYCSPSGINIYDKGTGQVTLLDKEAGLSGSNACSVAEDLQHNMWVVTEYGISHIKPHKENERWKFDIMNYNSRDGLLPGPYNQRSSFITSSGLLLIGCVNGVDVINPLNLKDNKSNAKTIFCGLRIYNKEISVGEEYEGRVILEEALNECRRLELSHDDNHFTIHLTSDQVLVDENVRFTYCLEGFSDQWIKTDPNNPDITFTGLPSGKYTLVVRILDDANNAMDEESRLTIVINPPFYLSWWAYAVYLALLVLVVRYWHRRDQQKLRLERMKLERENKQQENEMKGNLYSSMSEELRKPFEKAFTSLESLMNEENDEHKYEMQQEVSEQLKQLLDQINSKLETSGKKELITPKIKDMEITSLDEQLVRNATAYVEENLSNSDISVETMSEALNMSRVHLYKRLTSITGTPPSEFIRNIRLLHAERLLQKSQLSVSEISYKVGFNNPRYFSKYFKEKYGILPSQYKNEKDDEWLK